MTLSSSAGLIPRNNWDYGIGALAAAASGIRRNVSDAPRFGDIFQQDPIWTNAGRTSLYAILKGLGLPAGAEVGVPLFCCSVVFEAIRQAGLNPRFVDSGEADHNLSAEDLRRKRDGLAAIVAVHMFGDPADMDEINAVADGIPVIEDCAQSLLSTYKGRQTGLLSTVSFFSFRCGKYVSAGEGSAILCRDPDLHARIARTAASFPRPSDARMLADALSTYAKATLYSRPLYGLAGYPIGMRLDKRLNLTAKDGFAPGRIAASHLAIIDARIARFHEKVTLQRRHARMLLDSVSPGAFSLPTERPDRTRNWSQFPLRFRTTEHRDLMAAHLMARGIDTARYLDGIAAQASGAYGYRGDCPNAERLAATTLLVPIHYNLRAGDLEHIARAINDAARALPHAS